MDGLGWGKGHAVGSGRLLYEREESDGCLSDVAVLRGERADALLIAAAMRCSLSLSTRVRWWRDTEPVGAGSA
jgi:hypothetical protein